MATSTAAVALPNASSTTPGDFSDSASLSVHSLTLYYHPLSPFSRKVWIVALELGLTHLITLHQVFVAPVVKPISFPGWSENNELVGRHNPVAKIPTLVVQEAGTEDYALYDSKVIAEFLEHLAGKKRGDGVKNGMYWKRQALHRAADQMADCAVLVAYEERIRRPVGLYYAEWVDGMRVKIERGLDLLERSVRDGTLRRGEGGDVGLEEIAVACCLGSGVTRSMEWKEGRERLSEWFDSWMKRRSYGQSMHDVEWKGKE